MSFLKEDILHFLNYKPLAMQILSKKSDSKTIIVKIMIINDSNDIIIICGNFHGQALS